MLLTKNLGLLVTAAALTLPATYSHAVEQTPVIVTATRTPQSVDETLSSVSVITREDIEKTQASNLSDLLSGVLGIDIASNGGGIGKTTNLYMRGTNSGHTLVLIDGMQIGSATLGLVAYHDIPVDIIERIEIVRGPRASLYGSEALGGVIQIFTKKDSKDGHAFISAGAGTEQTQKLNASYAGRSDNTAYSINIANVKTDGINVRQANDPDKDGYDRQSVSASVRHQLNKTDYIQFTALASQGTNEYDGFFATTDYISETYQETLGLKGVFNATPDWQVTLNLTSNKDDSDELENGTLMNIYDTERLAMLWQNDIVMNEANLFTVGLEQQQTSVSGTATYTQNSRDNTALFIQNNWNHENNDLLVSLRTDDNEAFGNHNTGSIAWGHSFGYATRLILSAGTGFKAPSFNDLYFPDQGYARGNPDLLPEESESYEIAVKQKHWQISAFKTTIKNLVNWDNSTSVWIPENIGNAKISGIEFELNTSFSQWRSQFQLSLLDPRNSQTGAVLNNRSRQSLRWELDKDYGDYTLGTSIKAQSKRYFTNKVSGYVIVDLRAKYQLNKQLSLQVNIGNALDKSYSNSEGYFNLGRNGLLSAKYQF